MSTLGRSAKLSVLVFSNEHAITKSHTNKVPTHRTMDSNDFWSHTASNLQVTIPSQILKFYTKKPQLSDYTIKPFLPFQLFSV